MALRQSVFGRLHLSFCLIAVVCSLTLTFGLVVSAARLLPTHQTPFLDTCMPLCDIHCYHVSYCCEHCSMCGLSNTARPTYSHFSYLLSFFLFLFFFCHHCTLLFSPVLLLAFLQTVTKHENRAEPG